MLPPLPPPLRSRAPWLDRLRGLILWGFGISLALHVVLGPLLASYKPVASAAEDAQTISVTQKIKVSVPTPQPTPSPARATPPPKSATAVPKPALAAAKPKALKLDVARLRSRNAKAASEQAYVAPRAGGENGAPGGTGSGEAKSGALQGGGEPSAAPEPTPAPKPACENPHLEASVAKMAALEYPESARELGATGSVEVQVSLTAAGDVTGVSIYRSSRTPSLDMEALRVARASTYTAEQVDCKPVAGTYLLHVGFTGNG